ncbi:MAG: transposase [Bacilli bacterium]|nr:transposase [Bacilli bacterium]
MPRPIDPNAKYRVSIHNIGGYRYASTQPSYRDPNTGKLTHKRIHWGTLDDNNKFMPGPKYIFASIEERSKLAFPEDWDMCELEKLSGGRKPGRPVIESQDENRLYGDIWLMERVADATGIREDLMKTFDGNREMVDAVLTLAYFPMSGRGTYDHLAAWARIAKAPYGGDLSSPNITALTQSITERNRMDLFRLRAKRLGKDELCAVDSTSRSVWGGSLPDICFGKSEDRLPLPQTVEVVVYTLSGHMPVYYRTFPGNVPDSRSLETVLADLKNAGFKDLVLITDRGYESIRNLETYIDKGQPMVMGTKVGQSHVKREIDGFGDFGHHPEGMEVDSAERIYFKQYELEYRIEGKRDSVKKADKLRLNLYFDPVRRSQELIDLDVALKEQRESLEGILRDGSPLDDDATVKRIYRFYDLVYDGETRKLQNFSLNEEKVKRARRESGFFANTTHGVDFDAMTAQNHYKLRDEQEKYFGMMKEIMGADRQRNWSELGKEGRLLILFVSQIIGCYMAYIRKTKLDKKFRSLQSLLDEMRPIRYIEHPNTKATITPFVGNQIKICEAFGFETPEGCAPEYVARKTTKGMRGRPRKNKLVVREEN